MRPIRFEPRFVGKIWGGRRLQKVFGKKIPDGTIGEAWEISGHRANLTTISSGPRKGMTLYDLARGFGKSVFGSVYRECLAEFPLLYKFIDASDVLSVQVHPDDAYAREHENSLGKSESWFIIDCDPGSVLYRGFTDGATLKDFDRLLPEGRLNEILRSVPVSPGDCIDLPARTVHAIGSGILLSEIQQSSDVTYRVYDWNRMGDDGKPRPLHVEKARDVMDFSCDTPDKVQPVEVPADGGTHEILISSEYFVLERFMVRSRLSVSGNGFAILSAVVGTGTIHCYDGDEPLKAGDSLLVPADLHEFALSSTDGLTVLTARLP